MSAKMDVIIKVSLRRRCGPLPKLLRTLVSTERPRLGVKNHTNVQNSAIILILIADKYVVPPGNVKIWPQVRPIHIFLIQGSKFNS